MKKRLRAASREDYNTDSQNPNDKEIQSGCQQRIADAQERRVALAEETVKLLKVELTPKTLILQENEELRKRAEKAEGLLQKATSATSEALGKLKLQATGVKHLYRKIAALRGVITKLKGKLRCDNLNAHIKEHLKLVGK